MTPPNPARENTAGAGGVPKRRFYSERDLAGVLGVSTKTLQGWRCRSLGPPWRKFCGAVRYDASEFDAWVRAQPRGGGGVPT